MQWNSPIVYGTDREHTKVYHNERHCFNCENFVSEECNANVQIGGKFTFKLDYPEERQKVYLARVLGSVCHNYKLTGKEWDR